jgi:hypothetical protein
MSTPPRPARLKRIKTSHLLVLFVLGSLSCVTNRNVTDRAIDKIPIHLDVPDHPILQDNKQFEFTVRYSDTGWTPPLVLEVECSDGIDCGLPSQNLSAVAGNHQLKYVATVTRPVNLVEVDAALKDGSNKKVGDGSTGSDLGFGDLQLVTNLEDEPITAGDERRLRIWFVDKTKNRVRPTVSVQVVVSSENGCADFKYQARQEDKADYVGVKSVSILANQYEPAGFLYIRPHTWFANVCKLEFAETIAGTFPLGPGQSLGVRVTPALMPSILVCFAGVITNFLISGAIRRIASVKAGRPVPFGDIFIGDSGSELLSMVIKCLLAYLTSIVITTSSFSGIQIDKTTLIGFFTLGFMIGFWPVEKIWSLFQPSQGNQSVSRVVDPT